MGSDSGGKCYAACLVVGKAGDFAEPAGVPSFDLELQVKSYFAASPVIAFPVGVTYMGSCRAACLVAAFPIICWDCVACLGRNLVASLVTAFPVTAFPATAFLVTAFPVRCHGLEPFLYFLGAAYQGGGQYFLETVAVGAVAVGAVVG